jgi:hypothetical protein
VDSCDTWGVVEQIVVGSGGGSLSTAPCFRAASQSKGRLAEIEGDSKWISSGRVGRVRPSDNGGKMVSRAIVECISEEVE